MKYRKYDPLVKKMIIETGNRNLFPNLNIPRTTINYWLKSSKSPRIGSSSIYEETISKLKKDNFKLNAKKLLIVNCFKSFSKELLKDSKNRRKIIINTVDSFKDKSIRSFLSIKIKTNLSISI